MATNYEWYREVISGSDLTGSNNDTDRTYTMQNSGNTIIDNSIILVVNGVSLINGASNDYTRSSNIITFKNKILDIQKIQVIYKVETTANITYINVTENKTGADLTGSDGATDRTYTLNHADNGVAIENSVVITVNGSTLIAGAGNDYTYSSEIITFLNAINNTDIIQIVYEIRSKSISSSSLLSDVILFIRDRLRSNITDPLSSSRSSNQKFVMTSYPMRDVVYPIITVRGEIDGDRKLGQWSEKALVQFSIEVRIWARNEKEKNNLNDSVYDYLRTNQYPTSTNNTSTNVQLWDFGIDFAKDLDDPGQEGVKSKIMKFRYVFIA